MKDWVAYLSTNPNLKVTAKSQTLFPKFQNFVTDFLIPAGDPNARESLPPCRSRIVADVESFPQPSRTPKLSRVVSSPRPSSPPQPANSQSRKRLSRPSDSSLPPSPPKQSLPPSSLSPSRSTRLELPSVPFPTARTEDLASIRRGPRTCTTSWLPKRGLKTSLSTSRIRSRSRRTRPSSLFATYLREEEHTTRKYRRSRMPGSRRSLDRTTLSCWRSRFSSIL